MIREQPIEPPEGFGRFDVEFKIAAGDPISPGDIIAIIETDHATQELEAFDDAIVKEIRKTAHGWLLIVDEL